MPQNAWPDLPLETWKDTYTTLHMWTQIVGKVRLALSPRINHWWEVPLYVNSLGLSTSSIPYDGGSFEVQFDFIHHQMVIQTSQDKQKTIALAPKSVAQFYQEFRSALDSLGIRVKIWKMPVEVPDPIPFDQDVQHASYDPVCAERFWRVLLCIDPIFKEFRSRFIGKNSPVHFFWAALISAQLAFREGERPSAKAPIASREKHIRTRSSAQAFGRAAARSKARHSMLMRRQNHRASRKPRSVPRRRFIIHRYTNFF